MINSNSTKWLNLKRTVRFGESDGAGVIHFSELLRWCHEAWEESLEKYGLPASSIFPASSCKHMTDIALPIVHCEADYFSPIYVGDHLELVLNVIKIDSCSFLLKVNFYKQGVKVAIGQLKHIAINSRTRERSLLNNDIEKWLKSSAISKVNKTL